jgi:hypothetical protein
MWWHQHRTCPTCKKRLKANDFYQITYKPQEFLVQEEKQPTKIEPERPPKNSIYTDISSGTLREIKNIDLDGSFGTKIDTLARHILWLRHNDPGAKSVIFSQYKDFLEVLAIALDRYKVGFSSVDSKDGISKFKRDPSVSLRYPISLWFMSKCCTQLDIARLNASSCMPGPIHQGSIWSTQLTYSFASRLSTLRLSFRLLLVCTGLVNIDQLPSGCIWSLIPSRNRFTTSPCRVA